MLKSLIPCHANLFKLCLSLPKTCAKTLLTQNQQEVTVYVQTCVCLLFLYVIILLLQILSPVIENYQRAKTYPEFGQTVDWLSLSTVFHYLQFYINKLKKKDLLAKLLRNIQFRLILQFSISQAYKFLTNFSLL